jgi:hypothetical protein
MEGALKAKNPAAPPDTAEETLKEIFLLRCAKAENICQRQSSHFLASNVGYSPFHS